jgi:hypothetical protein
VIESMLTRALLLAVASLPRDRVVRKLERRALADELRGVGDATGVLLRAAAIWVLLIFPAIGVVVLAGTILGDPRSTWGWVVSWFVMLTPAAAALTLLIRHVASLGKGRPGLGDDLISIAAALAIAIWLGTHE